METGDLALPDFKIQCKAIVIKIAWHLHKIRNTDLCIRIDSVEVNLYINSQLIHWEKLSRTGVGKIGYPHFGE
jgi:hypothetical protein